MSPRQLDNGGTEFSHPLDPETKIERLEAELAVLRGRLGEATTELGWAQGQLGEASRMIADLRRRSVEIWEDCPRAGQSCIDGLDTGSPDASDCRLCGGDGRVLKDGVREMLVMRGYFIPAEMVEGER